MNFGYVRTPNSVKEIVCKIDRQTFKELGYKTSPTIDLLIDEIIVNKILLKDLNFREFNLPANQMAKDLAQFENDVYGAIWVSGDHNEPILKSVAKMTKEGLWVVL